jgi:hypothetical protein
MPAQPLPSRPNFNADGLPVSPTQYVGWIDAMGIQSVMGRSIDVAANFIFKWCEERAMEIGYDLESIGKHRTLADQYFADIPAPHVGAPPP